MRSPLGYRGDQPAKLEGQQHTLSHLSGGPLRRLDTGGQHEALSIPAPPFAEIAAKVLGGVIDGDTVWVGEKNCGSVSTYCSLLADLSAALSPFAEAIRRGYSPAAELALDSANSAATARESPHLIYILQRNDLSRLPLELEQHRLSLLRAIPARAPLLLSRLDTQHLQSALFLANAALNTLKRCVERAQSRERSVKHRALALFSAHLGAGRRLVSAYAGQALPARIDQLQERLEPFACREDSTLWSAEPLDAGESGWHNARQWLDSEGLSIHQEHNTGDSRVRCVRGTELLNALRIGFWGWHTIAHVLKFAEHPTEQLQRVAVERPDCAPLCSFAARQLSIQGLEQAQSACRDSEQVLRTTHRAICTPPFSVALSPQQFAALAEALSNAYHSAVSVWLLRTIAQRVKPLSFEYGGSAPREDLHTLLGRHNWEVGWSAALSCALQCGLPLSQVTRRSWTDELGGALIAVPRSEFMGD